MSDQQSQGSTCRQSNQNDRSLNRAHIHSPSSLKSTPPTRKQRPSKPVKKNPMKKITIVAPQDDDQQWRHMLTRSIKQSCERTQTPEKRRGKTGKSGQKTAEVKIKEGKFEHVCPICLSDFPNVRGSLECKHQFCFQCIQKWCQSSTICPCCRKPITSILKLTSTQPKGPVKQTQRISVEYKMFTFQTEYDHFLCYQCGTGDNQHILLICDGCDSRCCHVYCDPYLDNTIPNDNWYCIYCRERRARRNNIYNVNRQFQIVHDILETNISTSPSSEPQSNRTDNGVSSRTRSREFISNSIQGITMNALRQLRRRVR